MCSGEASREEEAGPPEWALRGSEAGARASLPALHSSHAEEGSFLAQQRSREHELCREH